MAKGKKRAKILETKIFGLFIGIFIFLLFLFLQNLFVTVFDDLETNMLDIQFDLRTPSLDRATEQYGARTSIDDKIKVRSSDISIIGIDRKSLDAYGRWPFPRYREADLINAFSFMRKGEIYRENSLFMDVFFFDMGPSATNDSLLIEALNDNGKVFLESGLLESPGPSHEKHLKSQASLNNGSWGEISNIEGDWQNITAFYGVEAPLQPFAEATFGYGHANFNEDNDKFYRRQALVAKYSVEIAELHFKSLKDTPSGNQQYLGLHTKVNESEFERLEWKDKNNIAHTVQLPLTEKSLNDLYKKMQEYSVPKTIKATSAPEGEKPEILDSFYILKLYKDHFVPSITLSLALNYFHKSLDDITVEFGKYITIPNPLYERPKPQDGKSVWDYPGMETSIISKDQIEIVPYEMLVKNAVYIYEPVLDADGNETFDREDNVITRKVLSKPSKIKIVEEIKIPIDDQGQMLINFMGLPSFADPEMYQTYQVRPFSYYADRAAPGRLSNRKLNQIFMVGPFTQGMAADQKTTPVGLMFGVEIHANALNTIIMDQFIYEIPSWANALILFVLVMLIAILTSRFSILMSIIITIVLLGVFFFTTLLIFDFTAVLISFWTPFIAMCFTFLSIIVYRVMTEEKDKRRIRNTFGKYVNPKVVDQILSDPPELGGVDKNLTVFFSDIRGFTTMSESMAPQDLVNHLNVYLTAMSDLILEYDGTLDKYEGDAIMSFWGAPLEQEDHALRACKSALKQIKALKELNKIWPPEKQINIGIGLNTGIMTVGNMGSIGRMDYTVMGDQVNLGARLEGTNKTYGTNIIISENTYAMVKEYVIVRELDNIRVKGKNKPVLIYELIDLIDDFDIVLEPNEPKKKKRK